MKKRDWLVKVSYDVDGQRRHGQFVVSAENIEQAKRARHAESKAGTNVVVTSARALDESKSDRYLARYETRVVLL